MLGLFSWHPLSPFCLIQIFSLFRFPGVLLCLPHLPLLLVVRELLVLVVDLDVVTPGCVAAFQATQLK